MVMDLPASELQISWKMNDIATMARGCVKNMSKILFGSPIRQKPTILSAFLKGLDTLDLAGLDVGYMFVDDNADATSSALLREFQQTHQNVVINSSKEYGILPNQEYVCNNSAHVWKKELIQRITAYKNDIIAYARDNGYDYLFFVDSDLIMNPKTIKHLIGRNVDIVSNVFWTQWTIPGELHPQVWLQDEAAFYVRDWDNPYSQSMINQKAHDFFAQLRIPGLYKVGGLGACTLLNRRSIESGVSFDVIDNVSFWGEDRHFCIRARVLGLGLYVDTVYPAYHIYRDFYLDGVENYKKNGFDLNHRYHAVPGSTSAKSNNVFQRLWAKVRPYAQRYWHSAKKSAYRNKRIIRPEHKLTLSMIVKNEENRYLEDVLMNAMKYVDEVMILDDASTDNTVALCERILKDFPHKIVVNTESMFHKEGYLRKKQWDETIKMNPDWILFLDADEILEDRMQKVVSSLLENDSVDLFCFKLYDMWDQNRYRSDSYWNAHTRYMPFLLRYQPNYKYRFNMANHHCGRMPMNVLQMDYANVDIRVKHYGWSRAEDRKAKYARYMEMDPGGRLGIPEQYQSIMDEAPNLVRFEDEDKKSNY